MPILHSLTTSHATAEGRRFCTLDITPYGRLECSSCSQLSKIMVLLQHSIKCLCSRTYYWPILHSLTASHAADGTSVPYARVTPYSRLECSSMLALLLLYAHCGASTASYSRRVVLPSPGSQFSCVLHGGLGLHLALAVLQGLPVACMHSSARYS